MIASKSKNETGSAHARSSARTAAWSIRRPSSLAQSPPLRAIARMTDSRCRAAIAGSRNSKGMSEMRVVFVAARACLFFSLSRYRRCTSSIADSSLAAAPTRSPSSANSKESSFTLFPESSSLSTFASSCVMVSKKKIVLKTKEEEKSEE